MSRLVSEIHFIDVFEPLLIEKNFRNKIYHGGRGGAKSHHFALALLLRGRSKKLRILCAREVQRSIKDSVYRLLADKIEEHGMVDYIVKDKTIVNSVTGTEIIFEGLLRNIDSIKSLEKIDICWVEEGQSVSLKSWQILIPTIRAENSEIWISFNRYLHNDPVWQQFCKNPSPDTLLVKVGYRQNIFFPEVLEKERLKDKEKNEELYLHIWEGEPFGDIAKAAFRRFQVLAAMDRDIQYSPQQKMNTRVGVDVARFGDDKTVFIKTYGDKVIAKKVLQHNRTTEVAAELMIFVDHDKTVEILIDDTGVGGGVTDIMFDNKYNIIPIDFGGRAKEPEKFVNIISEMWFELRSKINDVDLPDDDELLEELCDRLYSFDNKQRFMIEPKRDYKKRSGKSPDLADATLLAYYKVDSFFFGSSDKSAYG